MLTQIFCFLMGILVFPTLYACLPPLLGGLSKRPRFKIEPKKNLPISTMLLKQLEGSLKKSTDVCWVNSFLQRLYAEMVRNFAFEARMKKVLLKKFALAMQIGVIKQVKIVHLDLGQEAPFIEDIRVVGKEEVANLIRAEPANSEDHEEHEELNLERLSRSIVESFTAEEAPEEDGNTSPEQTNEQADTPERSLFSHKNRTVTNLSEALAQQKLTPQSKGLSAEEVGKPLAEQGSLEGCVRVKNDSNEKQTIEFVYSQLTPDASTASLTEEQAQDIYKGLTLASSVTYHGGCRVSLEIELPRKIFVYATVAVKSFHGLLLLRMPAESYATRYEFAFARYPEIVFEVESGLNTGQSKILFQQSISAFLKKTISYTLRKSAVFPNWFQLYQGFIPSCRDIEHQPVRITPENIDSASAALDDLLSYTGMDFKIDSVEDGIFFRSSNGLINSSQKIYHSHFQVPEHINGVASDDMLMFEGLTVQESRLLNSFVGLGALEGVISGFRGLRTKYSHGNCGIVSLLFGENDYEFLRHVYRDYLAFQRNDPAHPDFMIFHIRDRSLHIYSYCTVSDYRLSRRRIRKLKKKLHAQPMAFLGSSLLYKMLHFKKSSGYMPAGSGLAADISTDRAPQLSELDDIFHEALRIDNSLLDSRTATLPASADELRKYLKEDSVRVRLFAEAARICNAFDESENIRTIILESIRLEDNFPAKRVAKSIVVHSYFSDDFIVDLCVEEDILFIHQIEDIAPGSILKLIFRREMSTSMASHFFEGLQLRISHARFLDQVASEEFKVGDSKLTHEICTHPGCIYFEFFTEFEDDFQFRVFSCKKKVFVFELAKLISNRRFRILFPTDSDCLCFTLVPKHRRNKFIQYRFAQLDIERDYFLEASVGLGRDGKFILPIKGFPTHVIFWERECDSGIRSYLEDYNSQNTIDGCGLVRAECKDYWIVFKNKEKQKKRDIRIFVGMSLKA